VRQAKIRRFLTLGVLKHKIWQPTHILRDRFQRPRFCPIRENFNLQPFHLIRKRHRRHIHPRHKPQQRRYLSAEKINMALTQIPPKSIRPSLLNLRINLLHAKGIAGNLVNLLP
jgi:hypothetical protein